MDIHTIKEMRKQCLLSARAIVSKAEEEERGFTDDERKQVAGYVEEAADYKKQIELHNRDEQLRKALADLDLELGTDDGPRQPGDGQPWQRGRGKSLGELFVGSEVYQEWFKSAAPGGEIPDRTHVSSPPVEVKDILRLHARKDLVTGSSDTSAGAFVATDYSGIYESIGYWPLALRNMISIRTTGSDLIEFVRQTAQVAQAAPTAESNVTEYAGATGEVSGEKPEGAMAFEKVQTAVKTIAVWLPATKRALADVGQLRGLIDDELRQDLDQELEDQLLNGNGIGENFLGLANTAGVLLQAWDTDILRTTRRAITTLLVTGRQVPTAWVLNPADWEEIELTQDAEDRYYYGGPLVAGRKQLWGVPVVQSFYQAEGTAYLGNWTKMVLWDRERATVSVSDSHEDFFTRNMVAILAEMRAAMGVIRPSAFVKVTLSGGS